MSLQIVRKKLLFLPQNQYILNRILCQNGAALTQAGDYHVLVSNKSRTREKERGKWRNFSQSEAGSTSGSGAKYKLIAGAAIALGGECHFTLYWFSCGLLCLL